jgi:hypothetical protein
VNLAWATGAQASHAPAAQPVVSPVVIVMTGIGGDTGEFAVDSGAPPDVGLRAGAET